MYFIVSINLIYLSIFPSSYEVEKVSKSPSGSLQPHSANMFSTSRGIEEDIGDSLLMDRTLILLIKFIVFVRNIKIKNSEKSRQPVHQNSKLIAERHVLI